jgi:hypothetical protein
MSFHQRSVTFDITNIIVSYRQSTTGIDRRHAQVKGVFSIGVLKHCVALFRECKGDTANRNPRCFFPIVLVTLTGKILDLVVAGLHQIEWKSDCAQVIAV